MIPSTLIRGDCYYLQYNNFMSLSDKESVIVSTVIYIHALGRQGEIKQGQSSQDSLAYWALDATYID